MHLASMCMKGESYAVIIWKCHPTITGNVPSVGTWDKPLTNNKSADYRNLLTQKICLQEKSADEIFCQKEICWQNLPTKKCWRQKTVPARRIETSSTNFAPRQPTHGWRNHSIGHISRLDMCLGQTFLKGPTIHRELLKRRKHEISRGENRLRF